MSMFNPTRQELAEESDRDALAAVRKPLADAYAALQQAFKTCDTRECETACEEAMMKLEEARGTIDMQWAMFGGYDAPEDNAEPVRSMETLDDAMASFSEALDQLGKDIAELNALTSPKQIAAE